MVAIKRAEQLCCVTLSNVLPGQVWFPDSTTYASSLASYFSAQQSSVQPQCIVSPGTPEDVSSTMHTVFSLNGINGTSTTACKFAIRSGGHASFTGASNIQDGLTIDLRSLNSIQISQDKSQVTVGAGATWDDVYYKLYGMNLSANGPRSSGLGIGGVSTGGGISFFGPRYGWTSDMVTNFEVVLYNGSIVNANDRTHSDLLWALRGGSNNFGIVTRITMETFEQGDLWGGMVFHESSTSDAQIAAFCDFNELAAEDEFASLITTFAFSRARGVNIVNNMEYTKAVSNPPIFEKFTKIPYWKSTLRITNIVDLLSETAKLKSNGLREATATLTIESTAEALKNTASIWNSSIAHIQDISDISWSLVLDPLPPTIYARHAETNAFGLTGRQNKTFVIMMLSAAWTSGGDDDIVEDSMRAFIKNISEVTRPPGALDRYQYLNYAAPWQDPIRSYGPESVLKLRDIRTRYDPHAVFTDWVPGGIKLPKSEQAQG